MKIPRVPLLLGLPLCLAPAAQAVLNFAGVDAAPSGSTIYYEGNQKGGPGTASNQPWRNSMGPGGNVAFMMSTPGLTFTDPTSGGTVTAPGGFTYPGSNFTLEQSASTFTMMIDYTNGFNIDNSGDFYDMAGAIFQGGTDIRYTPGMMLPDGAGGFVNANSADYGWRLTFEAFGPDDTTPVVHNNPLINQVVGTVGGSTGGGAGDDVNVTYNANSIVMELDPTGGADGILAADHMKIDFKQQTGTPGPTGADYVQIGKASFTYEFVDRNLADGITAFPVGTVFGYTLDGSHFVAEVIPEPSRAAFLAVGLGFLCLRRRR